MHDREDNLIFLSQAKIARRGVSSGLDLNPDRVSYVNLTSMAEVSPLEDCMLVQRPIAL
jgi:hypothetical protein